MGTLWQDLRYGIRMLAKSPAFTAVAILTLALGIGANTAIFSVVNAVLLRPLPYKNPDQLVAIWDKQPNDQLTPASYPEYLDWREQTQVFESVATFFSSSYVLSGKGIPEQIPALRASSNYLPTLGIEPVLGRNFRPEEEQRNGDRVLLLSYAAWKGRFGGDPAIVGKTLDLSDQTFTVIGVLPSDFMLPEKAELLLALRLNPQTADRGLHFMTVSGRLRPGLSLAQAHKEIRPVAERLQKERSTTHGIVLISAKDDITQGAGTPLYLLLGAVGFVLLIGCANVANLLLARAIQRKKEIAIRIAVGAGRGRLIRQLLVESILLGLAGGLCSLLLVGWVMDAIVRAFADRLPRASEIRMDTHVLLFALGISILTGILFGLAPAWESLKVSLYDTLKEGGGQSGSTSRRKQNVLIVGEVALSLVLAAASGLLIRSFRELLHVDKGFSSDRILTFEVAIPHTRYPEAAKQFLFFQQVLERLKNLPGVESVGMVNQLPLSGSNVNGNIDIEGRTFPRDSRPVVDKCIASADYFSTLRIPLVRGRFFREQDTVDAPHVAIINQAFARRYFPNEDPIGKRIAFTWGIDGFQEIVGVIGGVKHDGLADPVRTEFYVPYSQRPDEDFQIVMRTKGDPTSLVSAARAAVLAVDQGQPINEVETMDAIVSHSLTDQRTAMWLLGAFAGLALALTAVGIYGVISYSVGQRTREIGLRMALGAQPGDVMQHVVREGMALVLWGVGIGLLVGLAATKVLASQIYGVSPRDPLTFAAVALLLVGVALVACYIPARRATRVDPMVALRYE